MGFGSSEHSVTGATFGKSFGVRCGEGTVEEGFDEPWTFSDNTDEVR